MTYNVFNGTLNPTQSNPFPFLVLCPCCLPVSSQKFKIWDIYLFCRFCSCWESLLTVYSYYYYYYNNNTTTVLCHLSGTTWV